MTRMEFFKTFWMTWAILVLSAKQFGPVLVDASEFIVASNTSSVFNFNGARTLVAVLEDEPSTTITPLVCTIVGASAPVLSWRHNNTAIDSDRQEISSGSLGGATADSNTLTWPDTFSPRDSGTYSCIIQEAATITNLSFVLQVLTPVKSEVVTVNGKVVNRSIEVLRDSAVNITCSATGTLPLMFSWWRNGVLNQRRQIHSHMDTYMISSAGRQLTGEFACFVDNSLVLSGPSDPFVTSVAKNFSFVVIDKPSADFSVEVPTITSTSVILRWPAHDSDAIDNGNTPITGFSVECESTIDRSDRFPRPPHNLTSDIRQTNVSGLHPGRGYECRVTVWNKVGSATTNSTMITTAEEPPDAGPGSFQVSGKTSTSVSLTWEPPLPENRRGVLIRYIVYFEAADCSLCTCTYTCKTTGQQNVNGPAEVSTVTLTGLRKFTLFTMRIAAVNRAGRGPTTPVQVKTDPDIPSKPLDLTATPVIVDGPALMVSWLPPADENGVLENYRMTVLHTRTSDTLVTRMVTPSGSMKLSEQVKNLQRGEEYTVFLTARTSAGEGPVAAVNATAPAPPVITTNTSVVSLVENTAVAVLQCRANGDSPFNYSWIYNNTVRAASNDGSLSLSNVKASTHAGVYRCSVTNQWGTAKMTVTVSVQAAQASSSIIGGLDDTLLFIIIAVAAVLILLIILFALYRYKHKRGSSTIKDTTPSFYNSSVPLQTHTSYSRERAYTQPAKSTNFNNDAGTGAMFVNDNAVHRGDAADPMSNHQSFTGRGGMDVRQRSTSYSSQEMKYLQQNNTFKHDQINARRPVSGFNSQPYTEVAGTNEHREGQGPGPGQGPKLFIVTNPQTVGVMKNETDEKPTYYSTPESGAASETGNTSYAIVSKPPKDSEGKVQARLGPEGAAEPEGESAGYARIGDDLPTYTAREGDHILTVM